MSILAKNALEIEIKRFPHIFSNIFSQVVDVVILQNVKEKLLQPITDNEKQCWENAQYSRNECLEVAGIVTHLVTRSRWTRYVKYL